MTESVADELTKLVQLRDSGALTGEEFEAQKARLLAMTTQAVTPTIPAVVTPTEPELRSPTRNAQPTLIAAAICGAGVILGSVLPWASATNGFVSLSVGGMSGDGKITVVCGILLLLTSLALMQKRRGSYVALAILAGLIAAAASIYDATHISTVVTVTSSAVVSVGSGLWIVVVASVVGTLVVGSVVVRQRERA